MIRINLLAVERSGQAVGGHPVATASPSAPRSSSSRRCRAGLVVLVAAADSRPPLDAAIARPNATRRSCARVLAQVQQFEARKAQLQQRVTLIEALRRGQGGPVHVLDEISKAVPDRLWLTEMVQKGDEFSISGMTTSLTGLSDFVANLEASEWFRRPVDIIDSQVERGDAEIFKFRFARASTTRNCRRRRRRPPVGRDAAERRGKDPGTPGRC
jgi:Tfp pilus assembly protein PilN